MKLSIQLHAAVLSLSDTVSFAENFGVSRARSTVHNWVREADLEPEGGKSPDHVAIDESVIWLNDQTYWLHAALHRYGLDFEWVTHGRNAVERIFEEVKRRTEQFANHVRHASAESAESWLETLAFAWNQLT